MRIGSSAGPGASNIRHSLDWNLSFIGNTLRRLLLDVAWLGQSKVGVSRSHVGGVVEFGPLCEVDKFLLAEDRWQRPEGCLVFGALPRLRQHGLRRYAILLGMGFGIHMLCRQFESVFLLLAILLFLVATRPRFLRPLAFAALPVIPVLVLILFQNHAVTHSWITLPEQLSQYQYGVPASLTIEANPVPQFTSDAATGDGLQRHRL